MLITHTPQVRSVSFSTSGIPLKTNVDVAGDVDTAREVAGIVLTVWLQFLGDGRHVTEIPDGLRATDGEAIALYSDAHRFLERPKVGVDHPVVVAYQIGARSTCLCGEKVAQ